MRVFKLAILTFTFSLVGAVAFAEKRVALVIGNSSYDSAPHLKNPHNDALAVGAKFEDLGFEVVLGQDLTYDALRDTIRAFAKTARGADLTAFYYAGHGISVDGSNYVVPVDATLSDPVDWEFEVYDVTEIVRLIDRTGAPSLIFLDACRDNPMAQTLASAQGMSTRSLSTRGLSRIPTETLGVSGSVIAYATEPGQVASDGDGDNSPFATALLAHLDTANTDFASVTSRITREVLELTGGQQQPRFDISLTGPLILNEVEVPVAAAPVVPSVEPVAGATGGVDQAAMLQLQQTMFVAAQDSGDPADFQALIDIFPTSPLAVMAQNAIDRIEKEEKEQLALLEATKTEPSAAVQQTPNRMITAPLALTATPAVISMAANQTTEGQLALTKTQRKEVQLRLNLANFPVGGVDGSWGNNTRTGLRNWQLANGLSPTGYLNAVQHQMLVANTDAVFKAHLAANPNALSEPVRTSSSRPSSGGTQNKPTRRQNNGISADAIGGFIAGTIAGKILSK